MPHASVAAVPFALSLAACGAAPPAPPTFAVTGAAELVAAASSEFVEIRAAASPDGDTVMWGSTNRPGGAGGWDLWLARRTADGWSAPAPASVNSPENDFDPAFAPDGRSVYWFSNRPGGAGGDDLYRAAVTADGFGPAERLAGDVNTAGNEWAPAPSPDGKTLLWASDRAGGRGRHDLYTAPIAGGPAQPLPGPINTAADEFDATYLADGRTLVFARSANVDSEPIALYVAILGPHGYDAGVPLPAAVNVAAGATLGPSIGFGADAHTLYFSGARPEASRGKLDIYRIHYRL